MSRAAVSGAAAGAGIPGAGTGATTGAGIGATVTPASSAPVTGALAGAGAAADSPGRANAAAAGAAAFGFAASCRSAGGCGATGIGPVVATMAAVTPMAPVETAAITVRPVCAEGSEGSRGSRGSATPGSVTAGSAPPDPASAGTGGPGGKAGPARCRLPAGRTAASNRASRSAARTAPLVVPCGRARCSAMRSSSHLRGRWGDRAPAVVAGGAGGTVGWQDSVADPAPVGHGELPTSTGHVNQTVTANRATWPVFRWPVSSTRPWAGSCRSPIRCAPTPRRGVGRGRRAWRSAFRLDQDQPSRPIQGPVPRIACGPWTAAPVPDRVPARDLHTLHR